MPRLCWNKLCMLYSNIHFLIFVSCDGSTGRSWQFSLLLHDTSFYYGCVSTLIFFVVMLENIWNPLFDCNPLHSSRQFFGIHIAHKKAGVKPRLRKAANKRFISSDINVEYIFLGDQYATCHYILLVNLTEAWISNLSDDRRWCDRS